ncbi:MAG TPA: beta-ketoacyl-ACP synthase III [Acidimicrobiales bacterium]|jgi:3-oxoacyl-[acyl-carrier-protein] synthase-3
MTLLSGAQERHRAPSLTPTRIPFSIGGLGAAVPTTRISNHDLETQVETSDQWIVERTGIRERRVVAAGQATSDLALAAARAALADARTPAADLDLVVVATCTPDQPLPATAAFVARDLGVRCAAFDLAAACSGWVYGLVTAASILTATAGRGALLIGAEVLSPWMDPADRGTLPLFGDAGAAAVLRPAGKGDGEGPGLLAWDLGIDGDGADLLHVPAGGSRMPATGTTVATGGHYMKMSGREVFRRAVRSVESSCRDVLESAAVAPSDVALFVPHQANARIVDAILPRLGLSASQTMMNIDRYGNTSSASVPLALTEAAAMGRLADGDLVLLAGFGAGMTWATALVRWGYTGAGPGLPAVLPA